MKSFLWVSKTIVKYMFWTTLAHIFCLWNVFNNYFVFFSHLFVNMHFVWQSRFFQKKWKRRWFQFLQYFLCYWITTLLSFPLGSRMCVYPNTNVCILDDGGHASVCDSTSPRAAFPSFGDHEVLTGTLSWTGHFTLGKQSYGNLTAVFLDF